MDKNALKKIISMVLCILLLAGCGAGNNNNSSKETGAGTENEGGIDKVQYYNTYLSADPTSLDSAQASDSYAIAVLNNIMEPLTRLEEREDGSTFIAPAGAKEWKVSDDGLVWTFYLNDNTWTDGKPVTAMDYAYGISKAIDPNTGSPYSYLLMPIKNAYGVNWGELPLEELGVKAIDEKTLEITLEQPTAYFLSLTQLTVMFAQREDLVKEYGDKYGTEVEYTVCNGPFKIDSWVHNNEIVLSKNQDYWDKDKVKLETVNYKIIQDATAVYNSLENGSIDSAGVGTAEWVETFKQRDDLIHEVTENPSVYYQYYNQQDELMSNANVRKAFTLAIDREELVEVIYGGNSVPAYGFVPPSVTVGELEYRTVASKPVMELAEEHQDPKELLIKGLEELGMDTDPSKVTVTLSLGGTDQWTKTLAEYLQQTYKKVLGVNMEIEMLEWGVFISNFYNYDYQIGQMSWYSEFNDPLCTLTAFNSAQDGMVIGWGDERVDELLSLAMSESDPEKRVGYIEEIEDIILNEAGCLAPITYSKSNSFTYDYVKGFATNPFVAGYKYVYTEGREK